MMGQFAEQTASHYKFSREAQDAFAIESIKRAMMASDNGAFTNELAPVTVTQRKEQPPSARMKTLSGQHRTNPDIATGICERRQRHGSNIIDNFRWCCIADPDVTK